MSTTLHDRVGRLLHASGLDAKNFGVLCGLSSSHIGQITRGEVASLADKTIGRIATATGADRAWLAWGVGKAPTVASVRASIAKHGAKRAGTREAP